jgi:hypothetical protein
MISLPDLRQGKVRAAVYRDSGEGIFADTLVYGSGIGLIRRHKVFSDGRRFEEEFVLTGFMGAPFDASPAPGPLSIRKRPEPEPDKGIGGNPGWRGRDALGKRKAGNRRAPQRRSMISETAP